VREVEAFHKERLEKVFAFSNPHVFFCPGKNNPFSPARFANTALPACGRIVPLQGKSTKLFTGVRARVKPPEPKPEPRPHCLLLRYDRATIIRLLAIAFGRYIWGIAIH
jgi:hypothetical protein